MLPQNFYSCCGRSDILCACCKHKRQNICDSWHEAGAFLLAASAIPHAETLSKVNGNRMRTSVGSKLRQKWAEKRHEARFDPVVLSELFAATLCSITQPQLLPNSRRRPVRCHKHLPAAVISLERDAAEHHLT